MTRLHLFLPFILLVLHTTTAIKLFTLFNPYLIPEQSATQAEKQEVSEELPIYRDLPPIKKEPKDMTEALEATRNLKFTRPTLDTKAFYASLKKAAEEVRNVIGDTPPFTDIQMRKADAIDSVKKLEGRKESVTSKSSKEALQSTAKAPATNLQVKRSENSFVAYTGETGALHKAGSDVAVSVQAPFTNVQVRKGLTAQVEPGAGPLTEPPELNPTGTGVGVHVDAPFTNVQVQKGLGATYLGPASGAGVSVEAPFTSVKVNKGLHVGADYPGPVPGAGVSVEAPFTSVKVQKGIGYGYPGLVGVNVDVPFPSVKVKKVAVDVPAGPPVDTNTNGGGSYHEAGVHVDVPFVNVKVGGAVAKGVPPVVDEEQVPPKPLVGVGVGFGGFLPLPKRPGKPLDLDINIPGIFNLRLLRDHAGRGRLGIGVLPILSSFRTQPETQVPYLKSAHS